MTGHSLLGEFVGASCSSSMLNPSLQDLQHLCAWRGDQAKGIPPQGQGYQAYHYGGARCQEETAGGRAINYGFAHFPGPLRSHVLCHACMTPYSAKSTACMHSVTQHGYVRSSRLHSPQASHLVSKTQRFSLDICALVCADRFVDHADEQILPKRYAVSRGRVRYNSTTLRHA